MLLLEQQRSLLNVVEITQGSWPIINMPRPYRTVMNTTSPPEISPLPVSSCSWRHDSCQTAATIITMTVLDTSYLTWAVSNVSGLEFKPNSRIEFCPIVS